VIVFSRTNTVHVRAVQFGGALIHTGMQMQAAKLHAEHCNGSKRNE